MISPNCYHNKSRLRSIHLGFGLFLSWILAGCAALPQPVAVEFADTPSTRPSATVVAVNAPASGSLYQKSSYRPAFEDARARMVGDNITIQIVEKVSASQVSSSTANRTTSGATSVTAFPFISPPDIANLSTGTKSASDFSGKGGTESANTFYGTITATVVEVLPNGHLLVTGDKQIGVNQNVDVMRFSG
ncbi:MAG: flagellar basal body L-ring protein FlgH, partial [Rhodoferax sp.]|nr:flagellar basal body L-ring protein FlgH [Rhodoferax sp.]